MTSAYTIAAGLTVAIVLTLEIASYVGRRSANAGHTLETGGVEAMASGLLALLLAFDFSIAQSRFDVRQEMLVREANAIGTAYLRCSVLPAEPRDHCRALFRRYVDVRIQSYAAVDQPSRAAALRRGLSESEHIQREVWSIVSRDVRATPTTANAALMSSVNEVIDLDEDRRASIRIMVPRAVSFAIVFACLTWAALMGYAAGVKRSAKLVLWIAVAVPVGVVFGVALDFDRPRSGLITTEAAERAMTNLAHSMQTPPQD
jgi:hypothetical protein